MMQRWNPMSDMMTLRDAMDRLFQESFVRPGGVMSGGDGGMMPVDMYEENDTLVVKTSMPGVRPEDIDVRIEGDTLTITGETRMEQSQPQASGSSGTQKQGDGSSTQSQASQSSRSQSQGGNLSGGQAQANQRTSSSNQAMTNAPQNAMDQGKRNWYMREQRYARYSRSVTLPFPVNQDQAEATFDQGMLTLRLPKAEQARAKKISVKSQAQ